MDIPRPFAPALPDHVYALLRMCQDTAEAAAEASAQVGEAAAAVRAPSHVLTAARAAALAVHHASTSTQHPAASEPAVTGHFREDAGAVQAALRRLGVNNPDLLTRAADIDRASEQLIIEAAGRGSGTHAHSHPRSQSPEPASIWLRARTPRSRTLIITMGSSTCPMSSGSHCWRTGAVTAFAAVADTLKAWGAGVITQSARESACCCARARGTTGEIPDDRSRQGTLEAAPTASGGAPAAVRHSEPHRVASLPPAAAPRHASSRSWDCGSRQPAGAPGGAAPANSLLRMRAKTFSASLEPLTPPERNARRDTGFPAAASRRAIARAWSTCGWAPPDSWSRDSSTSLWSRRLAILVPDRRPVLARLRSRAAWSGLVPRRPSQGPWGGWRAGLAVRHIRGLGVGPQHVRQRGPMPRTRTGRQDTTVVIAHGARVIPA